jgi:hypothetical protein
MLIFHKLKDKDKNSKKSLLMALVQLLHDCPLRAGTLCTSQPRTLPPGPTSALHTSPARRNPPWPAGAECTGTPRRLPPWPTGAECTSVPRRNCPLWAGTGCTFPPRKIPLWPVGTTLFLFAQEESSLASWYNTVPAGQG